MTDIPRLKGLRVLIVEDDVMISMLVRDMLGDVGCVVAGAALDLDEALDMIERLGFDCAILDVDLGGAPSFPAADRRRDRAIPFAYATGHGRWRSQANGSRGSGLAQALPRAGRYRRAGPARRPGSG